MNKLLAAAKSCIVLLVALALTLLLFLLYFVNQNIITTNNLSDYIIGNSSVCSKLEVVENGRFTSYFEGYCFDVSEPYDFYNFGLNDYGEGFYINSATALVKDNKVYKLPTTALLRPELNSLPQAAQLTKMEVYNFYVGTGSKFFRFLLPKGEYEIAFIHTNHENKAFIVLTGERWNNI